jgi:hypothetical protein
MAATIAADPLRAKICVPLKIFPERHRHALRFVADSPRAQHSE